MPATASRSASPPSIGTALVVGAFNGVLIAYLGFPPFVVTLGMLSIARSLAMVASNNTVVFQFGPDHDKLLALGGGAWLFGIANPVLYMIVLALITGFVLRWTKFGRHLFAIGGNEHAATLTGVPVRPIKVAVYMISALSAGIAGIIETGWLGAVTTNIGTGMELQVIAAAVIGGANLAGGVGTAFGALVGAALIEVIRNSLGLLGINAFWQGTFIGGCIIIAVAFDRMRLNALTPSAEGEGGRVFLLSPAGVPGRDEAPGALDSAGGVGHTGGLSPALGSRGGSHY